MPTMVATAPGPVAAWSVDETLTTATDAVNRDDLPALALALEKLSAEERALAVQKLMTTISEQNLAKAERVAQALPVGAMRTTAIEILARATADRDADAAIRWALAPAFPGSEAEILAMVAERLVEREAKPTLERLLALPAPSARIEMLGYAAAGWARRDAPAALAWVRGLGPGEEKDRMITSMGFALAQSQPLRASEMIAALPEGRDRMVLIGAIGQTWAASDATEAWKWANQLPAGAARVAALAGIETGLGGAGARVARSGWSAGLYVGSGAMSVGAAGSRPLGVEREDALRRKFDEALRESPVNAASYLTTLPAPDRRDDMIDELVRRWLPTNPDAAKTWIELNIPSPARREELLREAGRLGY
ncbi:MAG: hypothetical protein H7343_12705 [Undibacterium sp.]|nr:hypothetical protein [Opitutaceae bacterium]